MDIERLIELLRENDLLEKVSGKRLTTQEMPGTLYLKFIMASEATNKPINGCMATAHETYLIRNSEKHLDECKLKAAAAGLSLEEWLVEVVKKRFKEIGISTQ